MLNCYNRGCGQSFDPEKNDDESCRFHPGMPFFHDAYKGWSCCKKKSVDFTEFLNIKGCTAGKHSNEKPPEPEKPEKKAEDVEFEEVKPIRPPIRESQLQRPDFETPLVTLEAKVAPSLKQQIDALAPTKKKESEASAEVAVGTTCKNRGCNGTFQSPESNEQDCIHHPGVPVFHEGLKYWSCCTKRTTDFGAFLAQAGCSIGKHKWIADGDRESIKCRYDWHQTASSVVVAVYAKMYDYSISYVKINPVRLQVCLVFPQQNNGEFNLDLELRGIVDVAKSTVDMFSTKVEIKLTKAEPGSWPKLDIPRNIEEKEVEPVHKIEKMVNNATLDSSQDEEDSDVDLDDVEAFLVCFSICVSSSLVMAQYFGGDRFNFGYNALSGDFGGPSAFSQFGQTGSSVRDPRQDRGTGPVVFPPSPANAPVESSGVIVGASGYGFVPPQTPQK
ncbi:cysteine and histidine-rich domain-containing protein morgana isoform X3 [Phlebotomus papatasi]|uniref:cysteine and histidine-rich domain-containing protein morgana isoform X3 n=1 Tax=Phlebotomus papatasi TaxID=29031 RepID=UPI00248385CE|nr:cysteine and histidine-rich domain-containing protein morgana isoform X3 [Phlebotomus papatasi]